MKTKSLLLQVVLIVAVASAAAAFQERRGPARASIQELAWLAGAWSGGTKPISVEERWSPPAGGAMLAASRTIKGDRMTAFEFLRIIERDGGLVYIAQPNGRPPTEFRLTSLTKNSATF